MLADLDPRLPRTSDASDPRGFTALGGAVLFHAKDAAHGRELWRSDGTTGGTVRLTDLRAGSSDGILLDTPLFVVGTKILFLALDDVGPTVQESDGTLAGTRLVARIGNPVSWSENSITCDGTALWFVATTPSTGAELWRCDGTPQGTGLVVDLTLGSASSFANGEQQLRAIGGSCWFAADDGSSGFEPWVSDGTAANTHRLIDIVPGLGASNPLAFTPFGTGAVFFAMTPQHPSTWSLWISDGTTAGTREVSNLMTFSTRPDDLAVVQGRVVFAAYTPATGTEPFASDGTAQGTVLLADIASGPSTSSPAQFRVAGGSIYFTAHDAVSGTELWTTDGTTAGTRLVVDLAPGTPGSSPHALSEHGGALWFAAYRPSEGVELWTTDGTAPGTRLIADFAPGTAASSPVGLRSVGSELWFAANDGVHGFEPVRTNGTNTTLVADLAYSEFGSGPDQFVGTGLRAFFQATTPTVGRETFATDGTANGTALYLDASPGTTWSPTPFLLVDGDATLWLQNGRIFRTDLLGRARTLLTSTVGTSTQLAPVVSGFVFGSGLRLWFTDGTQAGTRLVRDFNQSVFYPAGPSRVTPFGTHALFLASEGQTTDRAGLWVTDGTPAGTALLVAAPVGVQSGTTIDFVVVGSQVFALVVGPSRSELFVSDGISTSLVLAQNLLPTPVSNRRLAALPQGVVFVGVDNASGVEPWTSDGTPGGTFRLADLAAGPTGSEPDWMTTVGDAVFFAATATVSGRELFATDGSSAGTRLVLDIAPGVANSWPADLAAVGDRYVVFAADDGNAGSEPWTSDGTAAGSRRLADLRAGANGSSPRAFARVGNRVLFSADDGVHGQEPFSIPIDRIGAPIVETIGAGCAGSNGASPRAETHGMPLVGASSFAIDLGGARAQAPAAALFGVAAAPVTLPSDCLLIAGNPIVAISAPTDSTGRATLPLPIAPRPALQGAELIVQWIVADPGGNLLGSLALSPALRILIGR